MNHYSFSKLLMYTYLRNKLTYILVVFSTYIPFENWEFPQI